MKMSINPIVAATVLCLGTAGTASADTRIAQLRIERSDQLGKGEILKGGNRPDIRQTIAPAFVRKNGCWFYMDPNGQGQAMRQVVTDFVPGTEGAPLYHTITTRLGNTWNDRISSVRCDYDANVYCYATLYRENDFVGPSTTIRGDSNRVVNLTAGTGWDNAVTSFKVFCSARR